jgi:hypothetical protein
LDKNDGSEIVDPELPHPFWKSMEHEVWYHNPTSLIQELITNLTFGDEFDYALYHDYYHGIQYTALEILCPVTGHGDKLLSTIPV